MLILEQSQVFSNISTITYEPFLNTKIQKIDLSLFA